MNGPSVKELQRIAREDFGRELSDSQAKRYSGRLPVMRQAARLIDEWGARLGEIGPAAVHRTPRHSKDVHATIDSRL